MKEFLQIKWFPNLLMFLFLVGVIAALFILGNGYDFLLNNIASKKDLTLIQPFYAFLVICLTAFAGIAFILLWKHNVVEVEKNEIIQKYNADNLKEIDTGMLWLAAAMLCWEYSSLLNLYKNTFDANNEMLSEATYLILIEVISTLNSAFFILGISTFKFNKLPSWHNHRLIRIFRGERKYQNVFIVSVLLITSTIILLPVAARWKDIPDYIMSLFTITLLFLYFKAIFEDRKIYSLTWLLYTTLLLTLMAQTIEPIENLYSNLKTDDYFIFVSHFINITFKFFLTILFFALAYSYRGFLEKTARQKQNTQLLLTSLELAKASNEKERLRREMNHTIRGNLDFLTEKLRHLKQELSENGQETLTVTEVKSRLKVVGHLHNRLHEDNQSIFPNLKGFLLDFKTDIQTLFSIPAHQYDYEIAIENDFKTRTKHARNIASIIVELSLNAFKVYLKRGYSEDQRWLSIKVTVDHENDFLILKITDKGPGFNENVHWNFGLTTLHEVVEKDLSGIIKRNPKYKEGTEWEVYIPISKVRQ